MRGNSSPEIDSIIRFITLLNAQNMKEAVKIKPYFIGKSYEGVLSEVFDRFVAARSPEKTIEILHSRTLNQDKVIKELEGKVVELRRTKSEKCKDFSDFVIAKAEIFDHLEAGHLQRVFEAANRYNLLKITHLAQELSEYRWMKKQMSTNNQSNFEHLQVPNFSEEGKQLKSYFIQNVNFATQMNEVLAKALKNIFKANSEISMPSNLFTKECSMLLEQVKGYLSSVKTIMEQTQSTNRKKLLQICGNLGKTDISPHSNVCEILDIIVKFTNDRLSTISNDNSSILQQRNTYFLNFGEHYASNKVIKDGINTLIGSLGNPYFEEFRLREQSNLDIISSFKRLLQRLKTCEESLQSYQEGARRSSMLELGIFLTISKLSQQIEQRNQSQVPEMNTLAIKEAMIIFEEKMFCFLNEFDTMCNEKLTAVNQRDELQMAYGQIYGENQRILEENQTIFEENQKLKEINQQAAEKMKGQIGELQKDIEEILQRLRQSNEEISSLKQINDQSNKLSQQLKDEILQLKQKKSVLEVPQAQANPVEQVQHLSHNSTFRISSESPSLSETFFCESAPSSEKSPSSHLLTKKQLRVNQESEKTSNINMLSHSIQSHLIMQLIEAKIKESRMQIYNDVKEELKNHKSEIKDMLVMRSAIPNQHLGNSDSI